MCMISMGRGDITQKLTLDGRGQDGRRADGDANILDTAAVPRIIHAGPLKAQPDGHVDERVGVAEAVGKLRGLQHLQCDDLSQHFIAGKYVLWALPWKSQLGFETLDLTNPSQEEVRKHAMVAVVGIALARQVLRGS